MTCIRTGATLTKSLVRRQRSSLCTHPNAGTVRNVFGTAHPRTHLLYLKDVSGRHFLVDTGVLISILPASSRDRLSVKSDVLFAARCRSLSTNRTTNGTL